MSFSKTYECETLKASKFFNNSLRDTSIDSDTYKYIYIITICLLRVTQTSFTKVEFFFKQQKYF